MARFRNTSGQLRYVPEATPETVPDGAVFDIPDDRAAACARQPWFTPVEPLPDVAPRFAPQWAPALESLGAYEAHTNWNTAHELRASIEMGRKFVGDTRPTGRRGRRPRDSKPGFGPGVAIHWTCAGGRKDPHRDRHLGSMILATMPATGRLTILVARSAGTAEVQSWTPNRGGVTHVKYVFACPECPRRELLRDAAAVELIRDMLDSGASQEFRQLGYRDTLQ